MWIIGIDEAGYGPNLGPFVMSAVSFHIPEEVNETCLWSLLSSAVRRPEEKDDGRLLIEDSKVVYTSTRGLAALEYGVLSTVPSDARWAGGIAEILGLLGIPTDHDIHRETWFHGRTKLPVEVEIDVLVSGCRLFSECCRQAKVTQGSIQSAVICPSQFNHLIEYHGSKGAVLGHALACLLPNQIKSCQGEERIHCFIDKHGGRNSYAALLQNALCEGMVLANEEGMARSVYTVHGLNRQLRITFQPRADAEHFAVALASMVSKYVRELLMLEFNEYWLDKVKGLKPTAGYPGDSARYYEAIRPVIKKLGLAPESIWRSR